MKYSHGNVSFINLPLYLTNRNVLINRITHLIQNTYIFTRIIILTSKYNNNVFQNIIYSDLLHWNQSKDMTVIRYNSNTQVININKDCINIITAYISSQSALQKKVSIFIIHCYGSRS